jgi:hypothetical protein
VLTSIYISSKDLLLYQKAPTSTNKTTPKNTGIKTASKIFVMPFYYFLPSNTTGGIGISIKGGSGSGTLVNQGL